jgi:carboxyl-terminal processing protease
MVGRVANEVVVYIRGEENTSVQLTILREGVEDLLTFNLTRRRVANRSSVEHGLTEDPYIGSIRIREFDHLTPSLFTEALEDLMEHNIRGLIIDVRFNPGGVLSAVNAVARRILPEGLIVYTEDRHGNRDEYRSNGRNTLDIPLVVLVNENSASASEILAGAVQDHGIGIVIGKATFGKVVVQKIFNLPDGSAVKLTVSSYFTPLGRDLGEGGIIPDIEVEFDRELFNEEGIDTQIDHAIEYLRDIIY